MTIITNDFLQSLNTLLLSGLTTLVIIISGLEASAGWALVRRFSIFTNENPVVADSTGITIMPHSNNFLVCDANIDDKALKKYFRGANMFEIDVTNARFVSSLSTLEYSQEPTGLVYHPTRKTFFITDDNKEKVFEIDTEGNLLRQFDTSSLGSNDPEGITCDPKTGHLYLVDGSRALIIELTPSGSFVSKIKLNKVDIRNPQGVTYDPTSKHFYLVSTKNLAIFELSQKGELVSVFDLSPFGILRPEGLTLTSTSDISGNTAKVSVCIADGKLHRHPDGAIYEIALTRPHIDNDVYVSLVGEANGFGFRGNEPGFAIGDHNHNNLLESDESLPNLDGKVGIWLKPDQDFFNNQHSKNNDKTDVCLNLTELEPVTLIHKFDLEGHVPVWARLTIVVGDARSLPGFRSEVRVGGNFIGVILGSKTIKPNDGEISRTVLELSEKSLAYLGKGSLEVEIRRPPGSGPDDIAIDYSRLEIAVKK